MSYDDPYSVYTDAPVIAEEIGRGGNSGGPDITYDPEDDKTSGGGLAALMKGVGPLATLFGGALSGYGAVNRNKALADAYRADADNMAAQIQANTAQAFADEKVRSQKLQEVLASQTAIQASRGVDDNTGSAQAIAKRSTDNSTFENSQMWFQTNTRNQQLTTQMGAYRSRADAADEAASIAGLSAGVKTAGELGSSLGSVISGAGSAIGALGSIFGGGGSKIISDSIGVIGSAAGAAGSAIADAGSSAASAIGDAASDVGDVVGDVIGDIADFFDW